MFPSTAVRYLKLTWELAKINLKVAMEYRISFLIKVFGMVINDVALVVVWVIFFQRFPEINGWRIEDTILLFAIGTTSFGLVMTFGRAIHRISRLISQGELDHFLSFPVNVQWYVSLSEIDVSAIGDLLFGLTIFFFSGNISPEKFIMFSVFSATSAIILYNFSIIVQSMAFFVGNFEDAADQFFHALLGFTLYPQTVFHGALKIIMLTIIPAFFMATLPVQLINDFKWDLFLILILFAVSTSFLSVAIFKKGLKRYESGNLMNVKT